MYSREDILRCMVTKMKSGRRRSKFLAVRLSNESHRLLNAVCRVTGKTKTRVIEESIYFRAGEGK